MVLQYFRDYFDDRRINSIVPNLSLEEIIGLCGCSRENGTRITGDLALKITQKVKCLQVTLKEHVTVSDLIEKFSHDLPSIVLYDGRYLLYGLQGPLHAGVFVGELPNGDLILNNPWVGATAHFNRRKFEDAWELIYNRAVFFEPVFQSALEQ
jgi:hypothetical protein